MIIGFCDDCKRSVKHSQYATRCSLCLQLCHDNCMRMHYANKHPLQPVPDGFSSVGLLDKLLWQAGDECALRNTNCMS